MSKSFSPADVATHKSAETGGMYIIIDEGVYDVTGSSSSFSSSLSLYIQLSQPSSLPFRSHPETNSTARRSKKLTRGKHAGFVDEHPGGAKILKRVAGKDASKQFWKYHNEGVLKKYAPKLKIGTVAEKAKL